MLNFKLFVYYSYKKYLCFMLRLEEILKERNMAVTDLEAIMKKRGTKLSRLSISKIINNVSSPKVSTLQDIANALQVDIRDMFNYIDEELKPIYEKDSDGNEKVVGYLKK